MDVRQVISHCEELMKKTTEKLRSEFSTIRTSRATSTLLDGIKVEAYGSMMPINQLASITVPEPRMIEIKPWDVTQLQAIEKAILKSNLGLTPHNDGKLIRLPIPPLTQERRNELIKMVHKIAEDFKVAIRNERRDAIEKIKKLENDKVISEDLRRKYETDIQKLTDTYIKKIEELLVIKEKEIKE